MGSEYLRSDGGFQKKLACTRESGPGGFLRPQTLRTKCLEPEGALGNNFPTHLGLFYLILLAFSLYRVELLPSERNENARKIK